MEEDPVNELKLTPLAPPAGFVPRPQLSQAVDRGLDGRLVLLVAPAGYGKTTLLSSVASEWSRFSRGRSLSLAWYQLGPEDDDAARFMAGMIAAVRRAVPEFGGIVQAALRSAIDVRGELQRLMALFQDDLRRLEPRRVFLILDGLHHITDGAIADALEQAIRDPSSPLRLIVATQTDPRFYLSVLRAQDALVEIRTEDLRWTPEELRRLALERAGRPLPQSALDDLMRSTGGWPSAANLASLILARELNSQAFQKLAPTEHGYGVLLRELLSGLQGEARDDVLRSSLLARLDLAGSRDGIGVENPEAFLQLIEERGLPVVRPAGHDLPMCYEPFFRGALQQELARRLLPQEYRDLQRQLASYYAVVGDTSEAFPRYLELGDHEDAARLLEGTLEVLSSPKAVDLLRRWLRALPAAVRERHPRLMVQEAELLLSRERLDEARVLLVASGPGMEASGDRVSRGEQLARWAEVRLLEGRYPAARDSVREALELLPEENDLQRAEAFGLEARVLEALGDLPNAISAAARGLLEAEQSGQPRLAVPALLRIGHLAYLRGDYFQAIALTARAVQRSTLLGSDTVPLSEAGWVVASAYLERGQLRDARAAAERALEAGSSLRNEPGRLRVRLALAGILGQIGQEENGEAALAAAVEQALKLPNRRLERAAALRQAAADLWRRGRRKEGLEKARLALAASVASAHQPSMDESGLMVAAGEMVGLKTLPALVRIRRLTEVLRRSDNRRWLAAGHRLLAEGYSRLGLGWRARPHLRSSLALAAQQHYLGMPLGLPSHPERLLVLAVREGIAHEMAGTLLGVEEAEARKTLAPLLKHKDPQVRLRAEQALKGVEMGLGRAPAPRLEWPGLPLEDPEPSSVVAIHSLGDFLGSVGGQFVAWPSEDSRRLAAYLVVQRKKAIPRDVLLQDLWPSEEAAAANVRLHEALYRVREALGSGYPAVDPGLDGRGVYRWDNQYCSIDAERFRGLMRQVRPLMEQEAPPLLSDGVVSLLEDAVKLYHGEFLSQFDFHWCEEPREELRRELLWITRLLMDHYMASRCWRDAIRSGLKSLKSDPLQEDVVRDLMVCYFRIGDRTSVDYQYRELKRRLARQGGVWPSGETRQLRLKLLGSGALWSRSPSTEPSVLVVGR